MSIDLVTIGRDSVPIPLITETGAIHPHLTEFLIRRKFNPTLIGPAYKSVGAESIKQKANHLRSFLENAEANERNYLAMSHEDIVKLLEKLCEDHKTGQTFNTMYSNVREFYEFLDSKGVTNAAYFPQKVTRVRNSDTSQNMLSHVSGGNKVSYEASPGLKPVQKQSSYAEYIISDEQYGELLGRLEENDPVYAVMAKVMVETYLRRSNVCEMPFRSDGKNLFEVYEAMLRHGLSQQHYHFKAKGDKSVSIPIYIHTWKMIYEEYIDKHYDERKELFRNVYRKRKNATMYFTKYDKRRVPSDPMWLKKTGAPVKPSDLNKAFSAAGLGVAPHWCRHTGVTRTLEAFCKIQGIKPTEALSGRFLKLLQAMMGHSDSETTLKYIHTLQEQEITDELIHSLPGNVDELDRALMPFVSAEILERLRTDWYRQEKR